LSPALIQGHPHTNNIALGKLNQRDYIKDNSIKYIKVTITYAFEHAFASDLFSEIDNFLVLLLH